MLGRRRIFAMEPLGSRGESPTLSPAGPPALEPTLGPGAPSTSRPTLHTDPGRPTSPRPPRGLSLEGSSDLRLAQETLWVSALNWPPPPSRFPRVHFPQISDLDSSPPAPVPAAVAPRWRQTASQRHRAWGRFPGPLPCPGGLASETWAALHPLQPQFLHHCSWGTQIVGGLGTEVTVNGQQRCIFYPLVPFLPFKFFSFQLATKLSLFLSLKPKSPKWL